MTYNVMKMNKLYFKQTKDGRKIIAYFTLYDFNGHFNGGRKNG